MASTHATTNGSYGVQDQYNTTGSQYTENGNSAEKSGESIDKDEVGWYFVERYYTTLSDKPDQLHLFYNKKSQFVYGKENEVLPVLVGRHAIQNRISQLDFQGSKVRVANVDSQQADGECIVIQVIGEIFNSKSNELKKFVQTFVLAKQHNGYFVLNDIFRSLKDTEEEQEAPVAEEAAPVAAEEPVAEVEVPKAEEPTETPKPAELDADIVNKKLESALASEPATETPITNGNGITAAEVDTAEEAPVAATKPEASLTPEVIEKEIEEEATKEIEKPKDPSPTPAPVAAPPKVTPAAPTQPAAPPKPMTWASRAAAAAAASATPAKPAPVVPTKVGTPPVQPRAAPPTPAVPATQPSQSTPTTSEPAEKESPPQSQGWQTAGSDQKRQARPQAASSPTVKDDTLGYVRNVTEKVSVEELKATLAKYGELVYFDVNRSKNCAFVEFANNAGYNAAVAANPHILSGENIVVEPRRPKAAAYGGAGYNNNNRGAMNNRGRGNFDQGRPGSQGGGRGGFPQRGRGVPSGAPRGTGQRPAAPTTAA